jgi:alanine racemase
MRSIQVDLAAIRSNYRQIKQQVAPAKVMAVVKANAYGHGMLEVAKTLDAIGADALGVADMREALKLRAAGIRARILAWIIQPQDLEPAARNQIEVGISTFQQLEAATEKNILHIKVDTGLGRNGFAQVDWDQLFSKLVGRTNVFGIFSHLSNTSGETDQRQRELFEEAIQRANSAGVSFSEKHLAASAAALGSSDFQYDMVRSGIAVYGLNPYVDRAVEVPLTPAMRVTAQLVNLKSVQAGQGVSYGYRYVTSQPTTLGLVPFGYGEGMPRISVGYHVLIGEKKYPVVGRVAMDQFVVDLAGDNYPPGQEVVIFGNGKLGEPTAEELGESSQSINYEIVTRIGGRAERSYINQ